MKKLTWGATLACLFALHAPAWGGEGHGAPSLAPGEIYAGEVQGGYGDYSGYGGYGQGGYAPSAATYGAPGYAEAGYGGGYGYGYGGGNWVHDKLLHPHGYWPPYSAAPWHGYYYHTNWGQPVALVVPPTASMQAKWSWGVGNTDTVPVYAQYGRQWPGYGPFGNPNAAYRPTPYWPSHTDQFGVYSVRGPW